MNPHFVLTSRWRMDIDAAPLWALLTDIPSWPRWWPQVKRVRVLQRAAGDPVGNLTQIDWSSAPLNDLRLQLLTTAAERPRLLEGRASGDLRGLGAWILEPTPDGGVELTCRCEVELDRSWMRSLAPLLRPVLEGKLFAVVRAGAQGMAQALGCRHWGSHEWSGHRRR